MSSIRDEFFYGIYPVVFLIRQNGAILGLGQAVFALLRTPI